MWSRPTQLWALVLGPIVLVPVLLVSEWPASTRAENPSDIHALPVSLDALYPPKADGPVWLLSMFGMGGAFSGMISDFLEGDFDGAEQGYAGFRSQYASLSQMVPEWAGRLPMEPIEALGTALESRDPGVFMPAVEGVNEVCHSCHVDNMTRVQFKFHWDDFSGILLTDPVTGQDMPFTIFMRMLDSDLSGAQTDFAQGQLEAARTHAGGLASRLVELEESCQACHESERTYFVDARIDAMATELGRVLANATPAPGKVTELLQGIGMESCHKCHLVHGPAALDRYARKPGPH